VIVLLVLVLLCGLEFCIQRERKREREGRWWQRREKKEIWPNLAGWFRLVRRLRWEPVVAVASFVKWVDAMCASWDVVVVYTP
jgi:hypothetical protein